MPPYVEDYEIWTDRGEKLLVEEIARGKWFTVTILDRDGKKITIRIDSDQFKEMCRNYR